MTRQTSTPLPQLIYPRVINLRRRLEKLLYTKINDGSDNSANIEVRVGRIHKEFITWKEAKKEELEVLNVGDKFSPASTSISSTGGERVQEFPWTERWFRVDITIPNDLAKKTDNDDDDDEWFLHFVAHGEFTAYLDDGEPWSGIDPCHPRVPLPKEKLINSSNKMTIWLEGGQWQTGFWFGLKPPTEELGFRLLKCDLEVRNPLAFQVYHDLSMLIEWVERRFKEESIPLNLENGFYQPLDSVGPALRRMLKALNDATDIFDTDFPLQNIMNKNHNHNYYENLLQNLSSSLKSIYTQFTADSINSLQMSYVGHAHMDLVWLWPERVTYRKATHTYSNVLRLMDKYPNFTFTMSQPPLFYDLKNNHPNMAQQIRKRILEGRWEFTGALEVEADTQIPVGEGLARSIIYGQERIKEVRGKISDTVWIPDVFGYSQCLPQLFKLAGIRNFFTTKILWSTITKFPHNSFLWKSPDGSEILTHLAVAGYNCKVTLEEATEAQRNYKQADVHHEMLCACGYGDGGGGPTEDHCERSNRMQNLTSAPKAKWSTVESFFSRLNQVRDDLPIYRGELFLEYHRAVHTTQAQFKSALRACERSLQIRESLRVISGNYNPLPPEAWLRYLFAHFHDATPGSSIHSVYKELNPELQSIAKQHLLAAKEEWPRENKNIIDDDIYIKGESLVVINPLAWERFCIVNLPCNSTKSVTVVNEGLTTTYPVQIGHDGKALACICLKGLSATSLVLDAKFLKKPKHNYVEEIKSLRKGEVMASPTYLDNGILRAEFDQNGQLKSMVISGEELAITANGAKFTLHEDNPEAYDAWDMDHHILWMKHTITDSLNLKVCVSGPALSILEGNCKIGLKSKMSIRYILEANSETLKIECSVDWLETNRTLRYELHTSYRGELARFGAPFGSVDRNQTEKRHNEEAQWEVPASRWASILDGKNQGLSIISEAKYGFRAKNGCLSVSLLRSPTYPDVVADKGHHIFRFAIAKHRDSFGEEYDDNGSSRRIISSTAAKADELFTPAVTIAQCDINSYRPMAQPFSPIIIFDSLGSVVPSWVMPSRGKGKHGFLVRLHEVAGAECFISFRLAKDDHQEKDDKHIVQFVDLNENLISAVESNLHGNYITSIPPYKISTLKISVD